MKRLIPIFLGIVLLSSPFFASAKDLPNQAVQVHIHDTKGAVSASFYPFGDTYLGRVSIASADIDGDGVDEIIVGAGQQEDPIVKIFSLDGKERYMFTAYHPSFRQGVNVAACDLDGDGKAEVITGAREGGGPHVRVFDPVTGIVKTEFFAYADTFTGGVNVACGNVDSDANIEIVTGPGITGGPHLKVFSATGVLKQEQFVGSMPSNSGLQVTVANVDRQGANEVLTTEEEDGGHTLSVLADDATTHKLQITSHALLGEHLTNVAISAFDFGHDQDDIIVSHSYTAPEATIAKLDGTTVATFKPFTTTGHGSQTIAVHTLTQTLQASVNDSGNHMLEDGKYIMVDVSQQRLYAFENGSLSNMFTISTGIPSLETPRGIFAVTDKLPVHDYKWSIGGHGYNIPGVKWNLRFLPHYYIHSATWNHNLGHKMSHGCVNMSLQDAEQIFSWAQVGTIVEVRD